MTLSIPRVSIIALGVAAFVSSLSLSAARADTSALGAPAPFGATAPAEPAPKPDFWVESGPDEATVAQRPAAHQHARRHAWRHRYDSPVAAATGVAGGLADLGLLAAYPFYCFPNYGSCSVRVPHRF
jgi:hypothetical protein